MTTAATASEIKPEPTWSTGKPEELKPTVDKLNQALSIPRGIDAELTYAYYSTPAGGTMEGAATLSAAGNPGVVQTILANKRKFNLLKSAIDSFCAMVVEVPAIDCTTTGGSWEQERSAEALGLFVDGVFAASKMKQLTWQCAIDCCLQRVGAVKVEVDGDNGVVVRRLLPHTICWNPSSGQDPRELFTSTPTARSQLVAKYPEDTKAIMAAPDHKPDDLFANVDGNTPMEVSDMVDLLEGYRTAEPGVKDSGCYVAMVGATVLETKKTSFKFHTIVPLRYEPSYSSWAGTPAGETLHGYQSELDDFAATIKEACVKGAVLTTYIENGHEIPEEDLANVQGRIVHHNPGKKPVTEAGATLPPEYFAREETVIRRAFDFMGLSYDASRGVKADGIASAKGQREVSALAQSRQLLRKEGVQEWILTVAKTIVWLADATYEGKKDTEVAVPGGRLLRRVKWSELNYNDQDYSFKCDAINALSRHPAARVEEVLELVQGKLLTERQGLKLVSNKDLQEAKDSAFAIEDFAKSMIGLALKGDLRQPDPYAGVDGLQTLIDEGARRYLVELVQEKPSKNLRLLRRLIEAAKSQLKLLQVPAANDSAGAQAAPAAGAPGDEEQPPPDLSVPGAGLPSDLPPAAAAPPVPGQGLA
jgi:hypothetical protein